MRSIDADKIVYYESIDADTLAGTGKFYAPRELIDAMPTIEPERWIPCSEKLPEKAEGQYWVCTDTGYQCQCRWTDDVYGLGSNGKWAWKIFDIPQYSHVVAWMPLPEPYKENKDESVHRQFHRQGW